VEAQEPEALPPTQVHDPALLLVQPHVEFPQLLSEPSGDRLQQPVLPTVVVHEDHQWSRALARWRPGRARPSLFSPFRASVPLKRPIAPSPTTPHQTGRDPFGHPAFRPRSPGGMRKIRSTRPLLGHPVQLPRKYPPNLTARVFSLLGNHAVPP